MNIFETDHIKQFYFYLYASLNTFFPIPHPLINYVLAKTLFIPHLPHLPLYPGGLHPGKADDGKATAWNIIYMIFLL